jgi:hypothetical protein
MRRTLGNLTAAAVTCLVLGVTAGCDSSSSTASDPAADPTSDSGRLPSRSPGVIEGAQVLPLISMTGAGGQVQSTATVMNTQADVRAFARQFRAPAIWHRLQSVIGARLGEPGHQVVAQILTVGCDRPPGAEVVVDKDGAVVLVPHEVASPLQECLAAVTTVAIAVLPTE